MRDLIGGIWEHITGPLKDSTWEYDHIIFIKGDKVYHDGADMSPEQLESLRQGFRSLDKAMEHMDDAFKELDTAHQHMSGVHRKTNWGKSEDK